MFLQPLQHPVELERGHVSVADMVATTGCRNDLTLGPFVSGCRGDFDFTILFERLILSVVPSVCFLVLSSYRIWYLRSRRIVIKGHFLFLTKLVSICNQRRLLKLFCPATTDD